VGIVDEGSSVTGTGCIVGPNDGLDVGVLLGSLMVVTGLVVSAELIVHHDPEQFPS